MFKIEKINRKFNVYLCFLGMTYDQLCRFGRLRKQQNCGPLSMFVHLAEEWRSLYSPQEVAELVKKFFRRYAINRHKMTVITPAYHADSYDIDDNRFDLRPFLYNVAWTWQFKCIDDFVERLEAKLPQLDAVEPKIGISAPHQKPKPAPAANPGGKKAQSIGKQQQIKSLKVCGFYLEKIMKKLFIQCVLDCPKIRTK